jgi:pseudouridine-5'-monophosphatase
MVTALGPCTHVLFDLDGVLLDTERLYTEATQAVVGRFGKTYTWEIKRDAMGRAPQASAQVVIDRLGVPLTTAEFLAARDAILEDRLGACRAVAGAEAFVRTLGQAAVPLGVATSSDLRLYRLKTQGHPWFGLFGAVVCGDDPRVKARKPSPDIFLAAASDLGANPTACLVFEDSPAGIQAALSAGMHVVALEDPAAPLGEEALRGAAHVMRHWGEASISWLTRPGRIP